MIVLGTIIARLHTPEDAAGERDVMHPETSIDAVLDPVTGISLPDRLANIETQLIPANVDENKNGFITPAEKQLLQTLGNGQIIIKDTKPDISTGCLWVHVDPAKTEYS